MAHFIRWALLFSLLLDVRAAQLKPQMQRERSYPSTVR